MDARNIFKEGSGPRTQRIVAVWLQRPSPNCTPLLAWSAYVRSLLLDEGQGCVCEMGRMENEIDPGKVGGEEGEWDDGRLRSPS